MEIVTRAAAAAVVGSILALLLRKYSPELSLAASIMTCVTVVFLSVTLAAQVTDTLREAAERGGVEAVYLSPVLKCVGIGMITHLAAQVCRDAQQGSVASAVELCGALCALFAALPLLSSLLAVVERLL